jgi:hypothetical protein
VPVSLDSSGVSPLSDEEIRTILRGADDLIMSGGRSLLARVLKGSKQQAVLEKGYLAIEYDYRLPLLKYTAPGWAIF